MTEQREIKTWTEFAWTVLIISFWFCVAGACAGAFAGLAWYSGILVFKWVGIFFQGLI